MDVRDGPLQMQPVRGGTSSMRTPHGGQHQQFLSEQEKFWAGEFGSDYTTRNRVEWTKRVPFWSSIVSKTCARSVFEVGCNAGWNLSAIKRADPLVQTLGIDVNEGAILQAQAAGLPVVREQASALSEYASNLYDLVFTAGVLIHIPPDQLRHVMEDIARVSSHYVLAVEYDAPQEEEIVYRGNTEKLWKRPFGKLYEEMGLKVVEAWPAEGFDKCTAWLMVKP